MTVEMPAPPPGVPWRRSSASGSDPDKSNCVEACLTPGAVWVRDSKDPEGGIFHLPASGWKGLLSAVRSTGPDQGD